MSRILRLTEPHLHGSDVMRLQRLLAKNAFGDFYEAAVDGIYGPYTASAVREAKRLLGYRLGRINGNAGAQLLELLAGKRRLSLMMLARRKARLRAAARKPLRLKALAIARTQIGEREKPLGSNNTKFSWWWWRKAIGWCTVFASWCYWKAGSKIFRPNVLQAGTIIRYGYSQWSEQILMDARAGCVTGMWLIKNPLPGDLALWNWDGGYTDHTSIGEAYSEDSVTSIDGNVGAGYVDRRTRSRGLVTAFVRVTR